MLSCSLIWSAQCLLWDRTGRGHAWPGAWMFAHGCEAGGVILRPGITTKVACGNAGDAGGECLLNHREDCPAIDEADGDGGEGPFCWGAWRPADVGGYLQRGVYHNAFKGYNEFLVHGEWWHAHLSARPGVIEAFIAGTQAHAYEAQRLHADYLREYRLTSDEVPLLAGTCDCSQPFEEATSVAYDPCAARRFGDALRDSL